MSAELLVNLISCYDSKYVKTRANRRGRFEISLFEEAKLRNESDDDYHQDMYEIGSSLMA